MKQLRIRWTGESDEDGQKAMVENGLERERLIRCPGTKSSVRGMRLKVLKDLTTKPLVWCLEPRGTGVDGRL